MSRNTVILLVVLCAAIAGLIALPKLRKGQTSPIATTQPATTPTTSGGTAQSPGQPGAQPNTVGTHPVESGPSTTPGPSIFSNNGPIVSLSRTTIAAAASTPTTGRAPGSILTVATNLAEEPIPVVKTIPAMEKDYVTATNRDTRLDIMMDIAETPGAEAVKALTRLFELETDTDLKVDLLDSLLGIEGFKDEKLIMLTVGARQGLPAEVRQSAIDGLIDLDDQRVIPVLNGLLNDPDPEIREGAKDALEMVQSQPVKLKP